MTGHRPRKRFGQHFLRDPRIIQKLIEAIDPRPDEVIIEIGPGEGVLTKVLLPRVRHLHVIEIDRDLAARVQENMAMSPMLTVHCIDVLKFDIHQLEDTPFRIVGNLPYNISTPLLFQLLAARENIQEMIFMLQKEVVDRLAASPGTRTYGRLSIMVQSVCKVVRLFEVPPDAFKPPPRVTSAVVRLTPCEKLADRIQDQYRFALLVREAFNQRRKTLRKSIGSLLKAEAFRIADIDPERRPESLTVDEFIALSAPELNK